MAVNVSIVATEKQLCLINLVSFHIYSEDYVFTREANAILMGDASVCTVAGSQQLAVSQMQVIVSGLSAVMASPLSSSCLGLSCALSGAGHFNQAPPCPTSQRTPSHPLSFPAFIVNKEPSQSHMHISHLRCIPISSRGLP